MSFRRNAQVLPARVLPACILLAAAAGLGGCSHSQTKGTRYYEVRTDMTPELLTLDRTHTDVNRDLGIAWRTNLRSLAEDYRRGAMMDRPSRLTFYPMPH